MLHRLPCDISSIILANISNGVGNYGSSENRYNFKKNDKGNANSLDYLSLRLVCSEWNKLVISDIIDEYHTVITPEQHEYIKSWKDYYRIYKLKKFIPLFQQRDNEKDHDTHKGHSCGTLRDQFNVCWNNMNDKMNIRIGIYVNSLSRLSSFQLLLHKMKITLNSRNLYIPELFSNFLLNELHGNASSSTSTERFFIVDLGEFSKENEFFLEIAPHCCLNKENGTDDQRIELIFLELAQSSEEDCKRKKWLWAELPVDIIDMYVDHQDVSDYANYHYKYAESSIQNTQQDTFE